MVQPATRRARCSRPTFGEFCARNGGRVWEDKLCYLIFLLMILASLPKHWQLLLDSPHVAYLVLWSATVLGCLAWASLAPSSYAKLREWPSAILRLYSPVLHSSTLVRVATLENSDPWRRGVGAWAVTIFLVRVCFCSKALMLLQWALSSRLCLPLYLPAQGLAFSGALRSIGPLCQCRVMQQAPSQAMVHRLYSWLDLAGLPSSYGMKKPLEPQAECWAVVAYLQLILGLVLPTLLLAAWEVKDFLRWRRACGGRCPNSWTTWLCEGVASTVGFKLGWLQRANMAFLGWLFLSVLWDITRLMAGTGFPSA